MSTATAEKVQNFSTRQVFTIPNVSSAANPWVPGDSVSFELITPEIARDLVENHNPKNRPLSDTNIKALVGAMERGAYDPRSGILLIDTNGDIIDFQHRLWAQFLANKTYVYVVRRGVDHELMEKLDRGRTRNLGEAIFMRDLASNKSHASVVGALMGNLWKYDYGARGQDLFTGVGGKKGKLTDTELTDLYETRKDVADKAVDLALSLPTTVATGAPIVLAAYLFYQKNTEQAEKFFSLLAEGTKPEDGVMHVLRENLVQETSNLRSKKIVRSEYNAWVFFMFCRTWKAVLNGEKFTRFRKMKVYTKSTFPNV